MELNNNFNIRYAKIDDINILKELHVLKKIKFIKLDQIIPCKIFRKIFL